MPSNASQTVTGSTDKVSSVEFDVLGKQFAVLLRVGVHLEGCGATGVKSFANH